MFTPTPVRNKQPSRRKKKVNVTLWTVCSTVSALSVIGAVALMVGWKQQVPGNQISEVQQVKAQVSQIREVYLEKLSRTDYNIDHLSSYSSVEGAPTLTGWRQLAAALWGQQLRSEISRMQANDKSGFYRLHYMPALEIVKFNSLDVLLEAASGNNTFYWGYRKTASLMPPVSPSSGMRLNSEFSAKNVVQFSPRSSVSGLGRVHSSQFVEDGVQNQLGMLSPEEFYAQLQDEDFWEDTNSQVNDKPAS